jgi:hypothetical protein
MKTIKLLLGSAVFGALTLSSYSQIVFEDNSGAAYDTTFVTMALSNGTPNYTENLNLELLLYEGTLPYGQPFIPVVTLVGSTLASPTGPQLGQIVTAAGDIADYGTIYEQSGQDFDLGSAYQNRTDYFQVLAWRGNYPSYAAALASHNPNELLGNSSIFAEFVPPNFPTATPADISNVGVIHLTMAPEPAVLPVASAGLALASTLLFRRRNS